MAKSNRAYASSARLAIWLSNALATDTGTIVPVSSKPSITRRVTAATSFWTAPALLPRCVAFSSVCLTFPQPWAPVRYFQLSRGSVRPAPQKRIHGRRSGYTALMVRQSISASGNADLRRRNFGSERHVPT
jgi:hypothetical protein